MEPVNNFPYLWGGEDFFFFFFESIAITQYQFCLFSVENLARRSVEKKGSPSPRHTLLSCTSHGPFCL